MWHVSVTYGSYALIRAIVITALDNYERLQYVYIEINSFLLRYSSLGLRNVMVTRSPRTTAELKV